MTIDALREAAFVYPSATITLFEACNFIGTANIMAEACLQFARATNCSEIGLNSHCTLNGGPVDDFIDELVANAEEHADDLAYLLDIVHKVKEVDVCQVFKWNLKLHSFHCRPVVRLFDGTNLDGVLPRGIQSRLHGVLDRMCRSGHTAALVLESMTLTPDTRAVVARVVKSGQLTRLELLQVCPTNEHGDSMQPDWADVARMLDGNRLELLRIFRVDRFAPFLPEAFALRVLNRLQVLELNTVNLVDSQLLSIVAYLKNNSRRMSLRQLSLTDNINITCRSLDELARVVPKTSLVRIRTDSRHFRTTRGHGLALCKYEPVITEPSTWVEWTSPMLKWRLAYPMDDWHHTRHATFPESVRSVIVALLVLARSENDRTRMISQSLNGMPTLTLDKLLRWVARMPFWDTLDNWGTGSST